MCVCVLARCIEFLLFTKVRWQFYVVVCLFFFKEFIRIDEVSVYFLLLSSATVKRHDNLLNTHLIVFWIAPSCSAHLI